MDAQTKIIRASHMIDMNDIIREGNPTLRAVAEDVTLPLSDEDIILGEKMMQFLRNSQDPVIAEKMGLRGGVGLAAPQIGILRRVVVIDIGEGLVELVNPEIIYEEGEQEMQEGCLSCPGVYGMTKRPAKVRVSAQNRNGERFEFEAEELFAVACCHEIDHLNGILFREHVVRMVAEDGHTLP